jgi:uncharacterized membrane protein
MTTNPYAAPKAQVADETLVAQGNFVPGGHAVPAARGWSWYAEGWNLFKEAPATWIGMIIVMGVIFIALAFIPVIGSVGTVLLTPVLTAGLMIGCRSVEEGSGLEFGQLFVGFRDHFGTLAAVGALYLAGFVVIFLIVFALMGGGMFALFSGAADPFAVGATMAIAILLMLALTVPLVMALWFAPALVVFNDQGAVEAMKGSFVGCLRNMLPFLVYGIIGLVLAFLASIPAMLGWLVFAPVIAASIYVSYRDIYYIS